MAASDHLSGQQFYHGTSGEYSFKSGDLLTPEGARNKHVYYTTDLPTAAHHAGWGQPPGADGRPDWNADAVQGRVYAVAPETSAGRAIGRHALDPYSGVGPVRQGYRTTGRLRVLHEVDRSTGEPMRPTD